MASHQDPARMGAGEVKLGTMERMCLVMTAEGYCCADIGEQLRLDAAEVERILIEIELKLGASNRLHAISMALLFGLIE